MCVAEGNLGLCARPSAGVAIRNCLSHNHRYVRATDIVHVEYLGGGLQVGDRSDGGILAALEEVVGNNPLQLFGGVVNHLDKLDDALVDGCAFVLLEYRRSRCGNLLPTTSQRSFNSSVEGDGAVASVVVGLGVDNRQTVGESNLILNRTFAACLLPDECCGRSELGDSNLVGIDVANLYPTLGGNDPPASAGGCLSLEVGLCAADVAVRLVGREVGIYSEGIVGDGDVCNVLTPAVLRCNSPRELVAAARHSADSGLIIVGRSDSHCGLFSCGLLLSPLAGSTVVESGCGEFVVVSASHLAVHNFSLDVGVGDVDGSHLLVASAVLNVPCECGGGVGKVGERYLRLIGDSIEVEVRVACSPPALSTVDGGVFCFYRSVIDADGEFLTILAFFLGSEYLSLVVEVAYSNGSRGYAVLRSGILRRECIGLGNSPSELGIVVGPHRSSGNLALVGRCHQYIAVVPLDARSVCAPCTSTVDRLLCGKSNLVVADGLLVGGIDASHARLVVADDDLGGGGAAAPCNCPGEDVVLRVAEVAYNSVRVVDVGELNAFHRAVPLAGSTVRECAALELVSVGAIGDVVGSSRYAKAAVGYIYSLVGSAGELAALCLVVKYFVGESPGQAYRCTGRDAEVLGSGCLCRAVGEVTSVGVRSLLPVAGETVAEFVALECSVAVAIYVHNGNHRSNLLVGDGEVARYLTLAVLGINHPAERNARCRDACNPGGRAVGSCDFKTLDVGRKNLPVTSPAVGERCSVEVVEVVADVHLVVGVHEVGVHLKHDVGEPYDILLYAGALDSAIVIELVVNIPREYVLAVGSHAGYGGIVAIGIAKLDVLNICNLARRVVFDSPVAASRSTVAGYVLSLESLLRPTDGIVLGEDFSLDVVIEDVDGLHVLTFALLHSPGEYVASGRDVGNRSSVLRSGGLVGAVECAAVERLPLASRARERYSIVLSLEACCIVAAYLVGVVDLGVHVVIVDGDIYGALARALPNTPCEDVVVEVESIVLNLVGYYLAILVLNKLLLSTTHCAPLVAYIAPDGFSLEGYSVVASEGLGGENLGFARQIVGDGDLGIVFTSRDALTAVVDNSPNNRIVTEGELLSRCGRVGLVGKLDFVVVGRSPLAGVALIGDAATEFDFVGANNLLVYEDGRLVLEVGDIDRVLGGAVGHQVVGNNPIQSNGAIGIHASVNSVGILSVDEVAYVVAFLLPVTGGAGSCGSCGELYVVAGAGVILVNCNGLRQTVVEGDGIFSLAAVALLVPCEDSRRSDAAYLDFVDCTIDRLDVSFKCSGLNSPPAFANRHGSLDGGLVAADVAEVLVGGAVGIHCELVHRYYNVVVCRALDVAVGNYRPAECVVAAGEAVDASVVVVGLSIVVSNLILVGACDALPRASTDSRYGGIEFRRALTSCNGFASFCRYHIVGNDDGCCLETARAVVNIPSECGSTAEEVADANIDISILSLGVIASSETCNSPVGSPVARYIVLRLGILSEKLNLRLADCLHSALAVVVGE